VTTKRPGDGVDQVELLLKAGGFQMKMRRHKADGEMRR